MLHTIFLYIHILSAIGSIGPLFALIPMLKKMEETDEASLGGFVHSFQYAISVVKHFGHILVASGVFLIILSGWTWTTSWVVLTIVGMGSSVFYLARAFKPTLKTFGTSDFNKKSFIAKLRKSTWIYILLLLVVLWLMVAKPVLW